MKIKTFLNKVNFNWNPKRTLVPVCSMLVFTLLGISMQSFTKVDDSRVAKVLTYTIQETTTTGFDCANMNEIPASEMVKSGKQVSNKTVQISIDQGNNATVTTIYHDQPEYQNDLNALVSKSVVSNQGTFLYGVEGELIPNPNPELEVPEMQFNFSEAQINNLGKSQPIKALTAQQMEQLQSLEGIQVSSFAEGATRIVRGNTEMISDPTSNSIESKLYEEGRVAATTKTFYSNINENLAIPTFKISTETETIGNRINKTVTTTTKTFNYTLVENDAIVVNFTSTNPQ